ncbi:MAG TPA: DUF433 domain-containing protein [Steroidobacteraceae bacterium]
MTKLIEATATVLRADFDAETRFAPSATFLLSCCQCRYDWPQGDRSCPRSTLKKTTKRDDVMDGKPCIRGMRVIVGMIVRQLGAWRSIDELRVEYPYPKRGLCTRRCAAGR